MKHFFLLLFLLNSNLGFACRCNWTLKLEPKEIESYDYIALIKVLEILPNDLRPDSIGRRVGPSHKIVVEEITHYKGPVTKEIIVRGGHIKFKTYTSCDMYIDKGDEWVIFGNLTEGFIRTGVCTKSKRYKNPDGFRDWKYRSAQDVIDVLDDYYGMETKLPSIKKGLLECYYPNGQVEKVANFKNGKKHGNVKYFYPSGALYGDVNYKNGKLHGSHLWFFESGLLSYKGNYKNNLRFDSLIHYSDYNDKYEISAIHIYTIHKKEGIAIYSATYSGLGQLRNEFFMNPKSRLTKSTYYSYGKASTNYYINNH
jgi:hypothetical protein